MFQYKSVHIKASTTIQFPRAFIDFRLIDWAQNYEDKIYSDN